MAYQRTIEIISPKLKKLVEEKGVLIESGRKISERVEELETKMANIDTEMQILEKQVDIKDLDEQAKTITDRFNAVVKEMEILKGRIYERMKEKVPTSLKEEYDKAKKIKEEKEIERNKIALKVQKYNDKIIPLAQKMMKEHILNEYEDVETIKLENGILVGTIFSHLEDFKERFKKGKK